MEQPGVEAVVNILLVEDSVVDAELLKHQLLVRGLMFTLARVETEGELNAELDRRSPDIVLCDFNLPRFDPWRVLEIAGERALPVIMLSHTMTDADFMESKRRGARSGFRKDHADLLAAAIRAQLAPRRSAA